MWIYPSSGASLLFEKWPDTYQPFMLIVIVLICLGGLCYIKAPMMSNGTCRTGIAGCLFSTGALIIFIYSVVSINELGGFVGAIPTPSWIDWGPDIGFFLILFSITIALIGLISKLKALRLRIHLTLVTSARATEWKDAQKLEHAFWKTRLKDNPTPPESLFRFGVLLKSIPQIPPNAVICDVGSGPHGGILPFIPIHCLKVSVDPIFGSIPCSEVASRKFIPVVGVGESLAFRNGVFDVVFCINALDHSAMPDRLLDNIFNVLKSEGMLVLMVHVVTPMEKLMHLVFRFVHHRLRESSIVLLSKNMIDLLSHRLFGLSVATDSYLHPIYFTVKEFNSLVHRKGFIVLHDAVDVSRFGFKDELFMIMGKK
jgi:hypothetical protein